jgi:hypothetical protein
MRDFDKENTEDDSMANWYLLNQEMPPPRTKPGIVVGPPLGRVSPECQDPEILAIRDVVRRACIQ